MLGVSLTMWSGASSSCLIFDRASEGVVETVLTLLAHHDGVGHAGYTLLQVPPDDDDDHDSNDDDPPVGGQDGGHGQGGGGSAGYRSVCQHS